MYQVHLTKRGKVGTLHTHCMKNLISTENGRTSLQTGRYENVEKENKRVMINLRKTLTTRHIGNKIENEGESENGVKE